MLEKTHWITLNLEDLHYFSMVIISEICVYVHVLLLNGPVGWYVCE